MFRLLVNYDIIYIEDIFDSRFLYSLITSLIEISIAY